MILYDFWYSFVSIVVTRGESVQCTVYTLYFGSKVNTKNHINWHMAVNILQKPDAIHFFVLVWWNEFVLIDMNEQIQNENETAFICNAYCIGSDKGRSILPPQSPPNFFRFSNIIISQLYFMRAKFCQNFKLKTFEIWEKEFSRHLNSQKITPHWNLLSAMFM